MIKGIHHAQITVPVGAENAARDFYCGVLNLREVDKPDALKANGGLWLQVGAQQLHIGIEEADVRAQTKAHIAYEVDDLADLRQRLTANGIEPADNTPIPGYYRIEIRDPFGNRVEFIQALKDHAPFLINPSERYKDSYIAAMREIQEVDGRPPRWNYDNFKNNFDEFIEILRAYEDNPPAGKVPQTTYWLIAEGEYAGRIDIRHHLNPSLERYGGHIGYDIRPSMRQKGYGTKQLALVLPKVWALGIERALITCDDDNIGSRKIIEANGGILQDKIDTGQSSLTRRYWVTKP